MNNVNDKLYIVIPAYNEEANIKNVVENWYKVLDVANDSSRLVVADSGSSDHTHELLLNLKDTHDKLVIISDTLKEHGPKLIALYKYAINKEASYIFQTDADGQTNPNEFYGFWELKSEYDIVIGNRKVRGDGFLRKFVEIVVCGLLRIYFGIIVPDANAPFRLMKREVLVKYINRFDDSYNLPNIMLTAYFKYYNEKMLFKEITFKNRQGGKNSINIKKIFMIGVNALSDFRSFRKGMN